AVGAAVTRWRRGPARPMAPGVAGGVGRARVVVVGVLAAVGLVAVGVLVAQHGLPLLAKDPQLSRSGFSGPLFDLFRWLVPPAAIFALGVAIATGSSRGRRVGAVADIAVA